jgi:hypothetical protein
MEHQRRVLLRVVSKNHRVLAATNPVWRFCEQLKEIGRGHHRGPPSRVVDLQCLRGVQGRADGQAQAPVAEDRVEPVQGRWSALS